MVTKEQLEAELGREPIEESEEIEDVPEDTRSRDAEETPLSAAADDDDDDDDRGSRTTTKEELEESLGREPIEESEEIEDVPEDTRSRDAEETPLSAAADDGDDDTTDTATQPEPTPDSVEERDSDQPPDPTDPSSPSGTAVTGTEARRVAAGEIDVQNLEDRPALVSALSRLGYPDIRGSGISRDLDRAIDRGLVTASISGGQLETELTEEGHRAQAEAQEYQQALIAAEEGEVAVSVSDLSAEERTRIGRDIETQLEEQLGVDVQPGRDFTLRSERQDGGEVVFVPEFTDSFRKRRDDRVRRQLDAEVDEAAGFDLDPGEDYVAVEQPGGGYRVDYTSEGLEKIATVRQDEAAQAIRHDRQAFAPPARGEAPASAARYTQDRVELPEATFSTARGGTFTVGAGEGVETYLSHLNRRMRTEVSPGRQFVGTEEQIRAVEEPEQRRYEAASRAAEKISERPIAALAGGLSDEERAALVYEFGEAEEFIARDVGEAVEEALPLEGIGPVVGSGGHTVGEQTERLIGAIPATAGMFGGAVVRGSVTLPEAGERIAAGEATVGEFAETTATSTATGGRRQVEYFRANPVEAAILAAPVAVPAARGLSRGVAEGGTGRVATGARAAGRASGRASPVGSAIAADVGATTLRAGRTTADVAARAPRPSVQRFQVGEASGVTVGLRRRTGKVEQFTEGATVARGLEGRAVQRRPQIAERAVPEGGIAPDLTAAETAAVRRSLPAQEAARIEALRATQQRTQYARLEPRNLRRTVEETLAEQGVPEAAAPEVLRTVRQEGGQLYGSVTQRAAGREVGEPGLARVPRDIDIGGVESSSRFAQRVAERMNRAADRRAVEVEGSSVRSRRTGEEIFDIHEAEAPQTGYSRFLEPRRGTYGIRQERPIRSREGVETTTLSEQTARKGAGAMEVITFEPRTVGELTSRITPSHPGRLKDIADFYIGERANIEALRQRGPRGRRRASRAEESLERFIETYPEEFARSTREQYRAAVEAGEATATIELADFSGRAGRRSPYARSAPAAGSAGATSPGVSPRVNVRESPSPPPGSAGSARASPLDPGALDSEFQSRFSDIDRALSRPRGYEAPSEYRGPSPVETYRPPGGPSGFAFRYAPPEYTAPDSPFTPSVPSEPSMPSEPSVPSSPSSPSSPFVPPPESPYSPPPGMDTPSEPPPGFYAPGGDDGQDFRRRVGFEEADEITETGILSIEEVQDLGDGATAAYSTDVDSRLRELERRFEGAS